MVCCEWRSYGGRTLRSEAANSHLLRQERRREAEKKLESR